jgi:hypothetical protein
MTITSSPAVRHRDGESHRVRARHVAETLEQPAVEVEARVRRRIGRGRQTDLQRQRLPAVEAAIEHHPRNDRSQQQPRAGQEHHRQRDLGRGERQQAPPRRTGASGEARLGPARARQDPDAVEGNGPAAGQHAEDHTRGERQREREEQDLRIERGIGESREIRWGQSQQDIGQQPGQSQTAHATHRPQRQSLCEQLGDQAAPSGAEGEPDGELAFARRTPREQEQRDVDGRDDPGTTRRPSESPRRRWWDRCRRIAPGPHGSCGGGWRRMTRSRAF